jgi:hypothetical protein
MSTGPASPAIGLNTQQDRLLGTETSDQTYSRGAKVLGFIGFGMNGSYAALGCYDPADSFPNSVPIVIPSIGGAGYGQAVPVLSSHTFTWTVADPFAITSISPTTHASGGGAFTLTVTGTSFVNGDVIVVNNVDQTTTFVNATTMTASVTPAGSPGTVAVQVKRGTTLGAGSVTLTYT